MQTSTIQRPQLFTEYLTELLLWNNEFLTYIKTTTNKVLKIVTSTLSNFTTKTKKQLVDEYIELLSSSKKLYKVFDETSILELKKIALRRQEIYELYDNATT